MRAKTGKSIWQDIQGSTADLLKQIMLAEEAPEEGKQRGSQLAEGLSQLLIPGAEPDIPAGGPAILRHELLKKLPRETRKYLAPAFRRLKPRSLEELTSFDVVPETTLEKKLYGETIDPFLKQTGYSVKGLYQFPFPGELPIRRAYAGELGQQGGTWITTPETQAFTTAHEALGHFLADKVRGLKGIRANPKAEFIADLVAKEAGLTPAPWRLENIRAAEKLLPESNVKQTVADILKTYFREEKPKKTGKKFYIR